VLKTITLMSVNRYVKCSYFGLLQLQTRWGTDSPW